MIQIQFKKGRVVLQIPDNEAQAETIKAIRADLNMQKFGSFVGVNSVVDDSKANRVSNVNPTGEFCRVAIGKSVYEVNPFLVSSAKDNAGNIIAPAGLIGGAAYYTAEQLSSSFETNYFV